MFMQAGQSSVPGLITEFFLRSDVGFAIFDRQLRYQGANPKLEDILGIPADVLLGKHVREVLGGLAVAIERALENTFATGRPTLSVEGEGELPSKPGRKRLVRNFFPLKDENGQVKHVLAMVVELPPDTKARASENGPLAQMLPDPGVLRSWKEIADYLRACVKTVQRWEQKYDLPVRRVSASKGAVVFAFRSEIDNWMRMRAS
jgi:PAS domain S-box-containing protein